MTRANSDARAAILEQKSGWRLLADEVARATWDAHLARFADCTPFQLYGYGEQMRAAGWQPQRFAYFAEDGSIRAMMQGNLKRYPLGLGLLWSPGAPVGDLALCGCELRRTLKSALRCHTLYCRFRNDRAHDDHDANELARGGWSPVRNKLTSNRSLSLDPCATKAGDALPDLARNWRRNLRKAAASDLVVRRWLAPDAAEAAALYREMEERKEIVEQYSVDELRSLFSHLDSNIVLYRCDDREGNLLALRGALVVGKRAWDTFAASSARGRERGASYLLFVKLVEHLRADDVRFYDLGGIDPEANPGVYRFKSETGALPLDYLGEWDWASALGVRRACDFAIRHRQVRSKTRAASIELRAAATL